MLIIDTVKPAEEPLHLAPETSSPPGERSLVPLVVRLYEPHGSRGTARLGWNPHLLRVHKVVACNLLEDDDSDGPQPHPWEPAKGYVIFDYTPFKVISFKLYVEAS